MGACNQEKEVQNWIRRSQTIHNPDSHIQNIRFAAGNPSVGGPAGIARNRFGGPALPVYCRQEKATFGPPVDRQDFRALLPLPAFGQR
jgi:hypothetical protein